MPDKPQTKTAKVLHEWKNGALHSSSGQKVTSYDQALAIGLSERQRVGKKKGQRGK